MSQSTPYRPQPPSISDPPENVFEGEELGREADTVGVEVEEDGAKPDWLKRAKDSFRFSTSYVDSNYRKDWDDSLRAFNNQHYSDSKYIGETFRKRSHLFRPKTRSVIRKNEAAAAAAYFSNLDLIDIAASDQSKREDVVGADVCKQLLQYRLTKTIPWYQVLIGGVQDAQVQGSAVAHIHWRFVERHDKDGSAESIEDKPVIDLIPIENLRIDPSAHWLDPINTSPYIIHLIPMYWCDVQERMDYPNPKGQRWTHYSSATVFARSDSADDSTRQARIGTDQDASQQKRDVSDYDIVWVHRHIHRFKGEDWEFYTIASEKLLTDPEPLKNTVWHGKRPYVMGTSMLETHKPYPTSVPILIKALQEEANDIQNQRSDNVKFVLNKRWIAKRGKNVDLASLVRNTPGGVTMADDPEGDIKEIEWQDVTSSAYLEQDRVDSDFSDLVGNFNPMQVTAQRSGRESTNTMRMIQGPTNLLTEYMMKTITETFVLPVLRQLIMLEQHYESDMVILNLAGKKSEAMKRYGMNEVTDVVLDRELNITVNVGMGATDPQAKMQRFVAWLMAYEKLVAKNPPAGIDLKEIWKEGMALAGYQGGERFLIDGTDPALSKAQQQIMQLTQQLKKQEIEKHNKSEANEVKVLTTHETNKTKKEIEAMKHSSKARIELFKHIAGQETAANEREGAVEDRDVGHEHAKELAKESDAA